MLSDIKHMLRLISGMPRGELAAEEDNPIIAVRAHFYLKEFVNWDRQAATSGGNEVLTALR